MHYAATRAHRRGRVLKPTGPLSGSFWHCSAGHLLEITQLEARADGPLPNGCAPSHQPRRATAVTLLTCSHATYSSYPASIRTSSGAPCA